MTLDYEIFGGGGGSVARCVVEPTRRLLRVAGDHAAPVTLFVEALEFEAMRRAGEEGARQPAEDIRMVTAQLQEAVASGHDVQLHLHPQWAEARYGEAGWTIDPDRWRIGDVAAADAAAMVARGRRFLVDAIEPVRSGYAPRVFRAGAWCIQPSARVLEALLSTGIRIDSSVAPGLRRATSGDWYDFRGAPSDLAWWPVGDDVCHAIPEGPLLELPIAVGALPPLRNVGEAVAARFGAAGGSPSGCDGAYGNAGGVRQRLAGALSRLARADLAMLDFCRLSTDSLLRVAADWMARRGWDDRPPPVVAIGHSKSFGARAEARLIEFLVRAREELDLEFGTFAPWIADGVPAAEGRL